MYASSTRNYLNPIREFDKGVGIFLYLDLRTANTQFGREFSARRVRLAFSIGTSGMRRRTKKTYENIFDAVEHGDFEAVRSYVQEEKNIPLTRIDGSNQTVAHIAAKRGDLRLLRYLLSENPSILPAVDMYHKPLLYRAIQSGSLDMVKYLIDECQQDVQEKQSGAFGNTALHFASELGQLAVLKYFLEEKRADVNVKNRIGWTPLFAAVREKRLHVIKYLVEERNADLSVVDANGEHILYAAVWSDDLDSAKYLLRRARTIDVDRRNEAGDTVLNRATKLNLVEFVKYLVNEMNADVKIPDNQQMTPLHNAVRLSSMQLVSFFVERGADIEFKNSRGKTPLGEASDYKIITYLDEAVRRLSRSRSRRRAPTDNQHWTLPTSHQLIPNVMPVSKPASSHYPMGHSLHVGHQLALL